MAEGARQPRTTPDEVATAAAGALTLGYSAPMPGMDSRYADLTAPHETRLLGVPALSSAISGAARRPIGETVLEAVRAARAVSGYADLPAVGYLAPLARAALRGEGVARVVARLSHDDVRTFALALEESGRAGGALDRALNVAAGAGRDATLRDAMRFAGAGKAPDPMAREYARNFEVTFALARPALEAALMRVEATRPALVQAYLVVLSEVPDGEVERRAGRKEAEEVSRMAAGALKAGGVGSRRGLQAIFNLDGLLRENARLRPSATETPIIAAAFLLSLARGPSYLNGRVHPAPRR